MRDQLQKEDRYIFDRNANIRHLLTLLMIQYVIETNPNNKDLLVEKITRDFGSCRKFSEIAGDISSYLKPNFERSYVRAVKKKFMPELSMERAQISQITQQARLVRLAKKFKLI